MAGQVSNKKHEATKQRKDASNDCIEYNIKIKMNPIKKKKTHFHYAHIHVQYYEPEAWMAAPDFVIGSPTG